MLNKVWSLAEVNQQVETWGLKHGFQLGTPKPLIRSTRRLPYVVSSPLDLYLPYFKQVPKNFPSRMLALQLCLRQLPLVALEQQVLQASLQPLYGVFSFIKQDLFQHFARLKHLLVDQFGLDQRNIYVMYAEDNTAVAKANPFQAIPYPKERLQCDLPLPSSAQYVKINYHYRQGLVPVINLCLIQQTGTQVLLDGVLYPERFQFILSHLDHQYALPAYQKTVAQLNAWGLPYPLACALSQHWRTILYLRACGLQPSAQKLGYVLRKYEREAFNSLLWQAEGEEKLVQLARMALRADPILLEEVALPPILEHFKAYYQLTKKQLKQAPHSGTITYEMALTLKERYGLYPEVYRQYLEDQGADVHFVGWPKKQTEDSVAPYHFDVAKNKIMTPKAWALERIKTPFHKAWQSKA